MKNPLVSVIIPTKNEESNIKKCLESIKKQTYKNIEIIVTDNDSADKTKEIATKYTKKVYNKGPERSTQRNFGASKSKGEYLLFIDADMMLERKVVEECVEKAGEGKKIGGLIIPEKSIGEGFWANCKALERSFYIGINWVEAPRFFTKIVFNEFNGYDEKNTGTEDYDLPQRIKSKYGENYFTRISEQIIHDEGKLSLINTLKKKYYYAKKLNQYRKNNEEYYKKQANIMNRYKLFFSNSNKLLRNPVVGSGMLFMKTLEFVSAGIGYIVSRK